MYRLLLSQSRTLYLECDLRNEIYTGFVLTLSTQRVPPEAHEIIATFVCRLVVFIFAMALYSAVRFRLMR